MTKVTGPNTERKETWCLSCLGPTNSESRCCSQQADFDKTIECVRCQGEARIAFVAHEGTDGVQPVEGRELCLDSNGQEFVCSLHPNEPKGSGYWPHDCVSVAVYFCTKCSRTSSRYNQG